MKDDIEEKLKKNKRGKQERLDGVTEEKASSKRMGVKDIELAKAVETIPNPRPGKQNTGVRPEKPGNSY